MTLTKMIYLARRNTEIAVDDFPRRWRKHAALAARFPQLAAPFVRVAQCTNARMPELLPGSSQDYDGVNLLALSHRSAVSAIWEDPDSLATMRPDELRVFSTYVKEFTMIADEHIIADGPLSGYCLIEFLRRAPTSSRAQFREAWAELAGALQPAPGFRHVLNHIVEEPPPGYEFDGVSELWLQTAEQAAMVTSSRPWQRYMAARTEFADATKTVFMLTRITHAFPV